MTYKHFQRELKETSNLWSEKGDGTAERKNKPKQCDIAFWEDCLWSLLVLIACNW